MVFVLDDQTYLSGTRYEKVIQCLEKAGWYQGRKTDIEKVESHYSAKGVSLSEPQKDIFREFYGIAEEWFFNEDAPKIRRGPDFEFYLLPGNMPEWYSVDEMPDTNHKWYDLDYVRDMEELASLAGESPVYIGKIGYYYPSYCYADSKGQLWELTETRLINRFDNLIDLTDKAFYHWEKWDRVRMKHILRVT